MPWRLDESRRRDHSEDPRRAHAEAEALMGREELCEVGQEDHDRLVSRVDGLAAVWRTSTFHPGARHSEHENHQSFHSSTSCELCVHVCGDM